DAPDHLRDTVTTNRDRLRAPKGLTQTLFNYRLHPRPGVWYTLLARTGAYSSGDRAPASGAGCGGSNPPRRTKKNALPSWKGVLLFVFGGRGQAAQSPWTLRSRGERRSIQWMRSNSLSHSAV